MSKLSHFEGEIKPTERRNPLSEDIDGKSSLEIVEIINREDQTVAASVYEARHQIAQAVDWIADAFTAGGRLFYAGAGTSGRLGQLDAAECPPTFGVDEKMAQAIIAGGPDALVRSVEKEEDRPESGKRDLLEKEPRPGDILIGISASSTTPYVHGALAAARELDIKTIFLTCSPGKLGKETADLVIEVNTGPEVLTGSTRLKAGTATKMVLNTITTGAMIRSGRTYGNLMVDLSCSNQKLLKRGKRILHTLTRIDEEEAEKVLDQAGGNVKLALAMQILQVKKKEAQSLLNRNDGFLRSLFQWNHLPNPKIKAVFFDMDGTILHYNTPNGFSTWAALGWAYQIYPEMEKWVQEYLDKEISYEEIWKKCALTLQGKWTDSVQDILFPCSGKPPLSRGFSDCVQVLKGSYTMGIVSSGVTFVAEAIRSFLSLDFQISNDLVVEGGKFTGRTSVDVHFDKKLDVIKAKAKQLNIGLEQICFVGDSINDIETLQAVGLPIAYSPKSPQVEEAAKGNVIGDFIQLPRIIEKF